MQYLVYVDGFCKGNGRSDAVAGGSFAVYKLDGGDTVNSTIHEKLCGVTPLYHDKEFAVVVADKEHATNNYAEATALRTAIVWLITGGVLIPGNKIHICMDSQLVLNQIAGLYKTRSSHLRKIYQSIYAMLEKHGESIGMNAEKLISFHWISGDIMKASVIAH